MNLNMILKHLVICAVSILQKIEVLLSKPCEIEQRRVIIFAENGAILLKESYIEV